MCLHIQRDIIRLLHGASDAVIVEQHIARLVLTHYNHFIVA